MFVKYTDEQELLAVSADGKVIRWELHRPETAPVELLKLQLRRVDYAVASPDGRWFAVSGGVADRDFRVELFSHDGKNRRQIRLPPGVYPRALSFDGRATKLAIGVHREPLEADAAKPHRSSVLIYDALKDKSEYVRDLKPSYLIDALSLNPSGTLLAVAGGDDSELILFDLERSRVVNEIRSPGASIWGVAFSSDAQSIGFRTERNRQPTDHNDWATGQWRVFDLKRRAWSADGSAFRPYVPLRTAGGWRIEPHQTDPYTWYVVSNDGRRFSLPFQKETDGMPRCYTFLNSRDRKHVRLAVGHRWGTSIFELRDNGPRRMRLLVGHEDDVRSVACSPDEKLLLTGSSDQTISAWSLADWPNQAELGASFSRRNAGLFVDAVAAGSPSWEAGLMAGDEVTFLAYDARAVNGGPQQWVGHLENAAPGRELYFRVKRANSPDVIEMKTTVRQRPVWRFFPTRSGEWVLWRWRDYYYDSSTSGDDFIGWQISGELDETPIFHRAEQFREQFYRPDKIAETLAMATATPEKVAVPELLPPAVHLTAVADAGGISATIAVKPMGAAYSAEPEEVSLWVNDRKLHSWTSVPENFRQTVRIPTELLRGGRNRLIAQAYNRARSRGDSDVVVLDGPPAPSRAKLYGLFVGVSDYSAAAPDKNGRVVWDNLFFAADDARALHELFREQGRSGLYAEAELQLLLEREASRDAIIGRVREVAGHAGPNDLFVLFLAGHGYSKQIREGVFQPRSFAFASPTFDIARPTETGVGSLDLYDALSELPCRKLLFLDCCHSGSANLIRDLTPDGVGPLIFAACDFQQQSYDIPFLGHGAFANALLEGLGPRAADVDGDENALVDSDELFAYVVARVPHTIELARAILGESAAQTPQRFLPFDTARQQLAQAHESANEHVDTTAH